MRTRRSIIAGLVLLPLLLATVAACKDDDTTKTQQPSGAAAGADDVQRQVNCLPKPDPASVDGWTYTAYVSRAAGLVVKGLRFGPRLVADELSVPYIRPVGFGSGFGHLTAQPNPADGDLTSTLAGDPECNPGGRPGVGVTYQVKSASRGYTFLVRQAYRFDPYDPATRCEASLSANCVRFWPTVTWGLTGSNTVDQTNRTIGLGVVQRFQFDPDAVTPGTANVTRDTPSRSDPYKIDQDGHNGMLMREGAIVAISGGRIKKWENWHQTSRSMVTLPGLPKALGGTGYAGCPECVHAHWSWFGNSSLGLGDIAQTLSCHAPECWTDRTPQILPGSHQTACAAWLRADTPATPVDWCDRAKKSWDGESINESSYGGVLALYWDESATGATAPGSGVTIDGQTMRIGDSSWPQLDAGNRTSGKLLGQTGAMFAVPARKLDTVGYPPYSKGQAQITTEPAYENKAAGSRLPAGWVQRVGITLTRGTTEKGPFYLRIKAGGGLKVRNVAPGYTAANTGEPWVDVYADGDQPGARTDVNAQTPRVVEHEGGAEPLYAYVVFDREPTPADQVSYELDAAPDGVGRDAFYQAATGRWTADTPPDQAAPVYFPAWFPEIAHPVIEPVSLSLTGDSSEWITAVRWSTWTATSATGTGVHNTSCKASCEPGQPRQTHRDVSITLDTPIGICGHSFYSRITLSGSEPETFLEAPDMTANGTDCTEPSVIPPLPFGVSSPPGDAAFTTPSRNITCYNQSQAAHLNDGTPLPPVAQQTVSCYVAQHEWLPSGCTFSSPGVVVSVDPYGMTDPTACDEGAARLKPSSTTPLVTSYGSIIDMGPAICTVTATGVGCRSRAYPTRGFKIARDTWSQS